MTHTTIEAQTRSQIAEILPRAIAKAMESYEDFLENPDISDAKAFKDHHNACKVAIAHVALLIKLAEWAELPAQADLDAAQHQVLRALIDDAEAELAQGGYGEEPA